MISTALHAVYTVGLATTAVITVCAFDHDVWSRDIDSSPSPFPITLLLWFICPCLAAANMDPVPTQDTVDHQVVCLPGCNCSSTKPTLTTEPEAVPEMRMAESLVRIPNELERRTSIVISLDGIDV
ncbi:hypothetical protein C8F01DRAFT_1104448 [Mycena amicta]|nr:hypothetical protein C8F01DRAFT_1104448 [Mycena amicta]